MDPRPDFARQGLAGSKNFPDSSFWTDNNGLRRKNPAVRGSEAAGPEQRRGQYNVGSYLRKPILSTLFSICPFKHGKKQITHSQRPRQTARAAARTRFAINVSLH
jgi:hypothetical protein